MNDAYLILSLSTASVPSQCSLFPVPPPAYHYLPRLPVMFIASETLRLQIPTCVLLRPNFNLPLLFLPILPQAPLYLGPPPPPPVTAHQSNLKLWSDVSLSVHLSASHTMFYSWPHEIQMPLLALFLSHLTRNSLCFISTFSFSSNTFSHVS